MKVYKTLAYRFIPVVVIFVMAVFVTKPLDEVQAAKAAKTTICRFPRDTSDNYNTIEVSENSVADHLSHGDCPGACVDTDGDGFVDCIDPCPGDPSEYPNCDPCTPPDLADECPCDDDDDVPNTANCWRPCDGCTSAPRFISCGTPDCQPQSQPDGCGLQQTTDPFHSPSAIIVTHSSDGVLACSIINAVGPTSTCFPFPAPDVSGLSDQQFATCLCHVAQYAERLNNNTPVTGGPPYSR